MTTYVVQGRRATETDALGRTTTYGYDDAGRLTSVTLPAVADAENSGVLTQPVYTYGYDAFGNQTSITDPKGRVTEFTFDELNRQTERELPLDQTESMQYNALGQLTRSIDFEGRVTDYAYDEFGRLEAKNYATNLTNANAETYARTVEYTYDALGRVVVIGDTGPGVTLNQYDAEGRLTQVQSPQGIINYAYNDLGQLTRTWTSMDTTGQSKVTETTYAYDALGRLSTTTQTWRNATDIADEATGYTYDLVGNLDKQANPNGTVADHDYDRLNRLVKINHFKDTDYDKQHDVGEGQVAQFDYELDDAGNRIGAAEQFDTDGNGTLDSEQTFEWEYDTLNRLTRETFDGPDTNLDYDTQYQFDLSSNRVKKITVNGTGTETTTYAYDNNDRLTTEIKDAPGTTNDTNTAYTYDNTQQTGKAVREGRTLGGGTIVEEQNYVYDVMGRMTGVDTDGDSNIDITYVYDGNGIRVATTQGSDTRTYVYDAQNPTGYAKPIEERVNGTLERSYTLGHAVIEQWSTGDGSVTLLLDGHGSTRALVDNLGEITESFTYDAFGEAIGFNPATAGTTWLFAGDGMYDPVTGFTYHLERWRRGHVFMTFDIPYPGHSSDPLSLHKYLYARGNPGRYTDPTGRFSLTGTLAAQSIRNMIAGAYQGAAAGVYYSAWGVESGLTVNQTIAAMFIDSILEPIDSAVEYTALAVNLVEGLVRDGASYVFGEADSNANVAGAAGGGITGIGAWLLSKYSSLRNFNKVYLPQGGVQANHLNQKAAFPDIPDNDAWAVNLKGGSNAPGSEHYVFHEYLEDNFWSLYRKGGALQFQSPRVNDYNRAVSEALDRVSFTRDERAKVLLLMRAEQVHWNVGDTIKHIPHKVGLKKP